MGWSTSPYKSLLWTIFVLIKVLRSLCAVQVSALIDLLCSYAPELDNAHIRSEAVSLTWIYKYIREHYGVKRTGRQMMSKYSVLKRKPNERLNAYWNRWQGFWAENRIHKNDDIKISEGGNIITATKDFLLMRDK